MIIFNDTLNRWLKRCVVLLAAEYRNSYVKMELIDHGNFKENDPGKLQF